MGSLSIRKTSLRCVGAVLGMTAWHAQQGNRIICICTCAFQGPFKFFDDFTRHSGSGSRSGGGEPRDWSLPPHVSGGGKKDIADVISKEQKVGACGRPNGSCHGEAQTQSLVHCSNHT